MKHPFPRSFPAASSFRKGIPSVLLVFLAAALPARSQDLSSVDFRLRDIDGKEHSFQEILAQVRGSETEPKRGVIIISFWAMWCQPCKQEMKALKPIFEKWRDKNLHYIAINVDNPRSLAKVKTYLNAEQLPYLHLLDPNSEVFKKLNGQNMPYQLIVDEQGKLIAKRVGFLAGDEKEIEADILKALERP
ncbi:MAG: TlpA disulfide reductase family protein [Bacteroidota bacterium]|nr:TlpA disulfide reductase family protein [Bacteroidota bacterium]